MVSVNKRARDALASKTKEAAKEEVMKQPKDEGKEAEMPKGEGDESLYYEIEAALEEDWKKMEEKEREEEKEEAAPSAAEVETRRLATKARAEEHWKEIRAIWRLEKNIKRKINLLYVMKKRNV